MAASWVTVGARASARLVVELLAGSLDLLHVVVLRGGVEGAVPHEVGDVVGVGLAVADEAVEGPGRGMYGGVHRVGEGEQLGHLGGQQVEGLEGGRQVEQ